MTWNPEKNLISVGIRFLNFYKMYKKYFLFFPLFLTITLDVICRFRIFLPFWKSQHICRNISKIYFCGFSEKIAIDWASAWILLFFLKTLALSFLRFYKKKIYILVIWNYGTNFVSHILLSDDFHYQNYLEIWKILFQNSMPFHYYYNEYFLI